MTFLYNSLQCITTTACFMNPNGAVAQRQHTYNKLMHLYFHFQFFSLVFVILSRFTLYSVACVYICMYMCSYINFFQFIFEIKFCNYYACVWQINYMYVCMLKLISQCFLCGGGREKILYIN